MQLRERLQNEKRDQATAATSLQAELTKIGDELSTIKLTPSTKVHGSASGASSLPRPNTPGGSSVAAIFARIQALETKVTALTSDMHSRTANLEKDVEGSLTVSERRAKKLDDLYKEASAENEALYERFNTELGKLAKGVRGGDGTEALQTKLTEALDEVARVKKENLRLRREVGGLRAVVGGGRSSGSGSVDARVSSKGENEPPVLKERKGSIC